jgi:hypothetical protein
MRRSWKRFVGRGEKMRLVGAGVRVGYVHQLIQVEVVADQYVEGFDYSFWVGLEWEDVQNVSGSVSGHGYDVNVRLHENDRVLNKKRGYY